MKIAINGIGVAGPTLAYWLSQQGHEPVLLERAPELRTGGYMIDFWGLGYDVADKMGLLPALRERGYRMEELRIVGDDGSAKVRLELDPMRDLMDDRFISLPRGELAAEVFHACKDVEARFGVSVAAVEQRPDSVAVQLTDGREERFDLLVGADGLHSRVRELVFGPEDRFEHELGCGVAAFSTRDYPEHDPLAYVSYTKPDRHIARITLRDDQTLFLLIFRRSLLDAWPDSADSARRALHQIFGELRWEAARMLEHLDRADDLYFDRVSQIRMDHWSKERVALVGDAAACVSLMAGEGTGLAMTESYVLASELSQEAGDPTAALARYGAKLRPFLGQKQKMALRSVDFFVPRSGFRLTLRDWGIRLANQRFFAKRFLASALRDDFTLP